MDPLCVIYETKGFGTWGRLEKSEHNFFHLLRDFYGPGCMCLPHNYWCEDKCDDARASMWNTGYPDTQKEGLSAQAHSYSSTHNSCTRCALLELCYFVGGKGSCKSLWLTCPFHTNTNIQRAVGPCFLLSSFLECGLTLEINEWVTGSL